MPEVRYVRLVGEVAGIRCAVERNTSEVGNLPAVTNVSLTTNPGSVFMISDPWTDARSALPLAMEVRRNNNRKQGKKIKNGNRVEGRSSRKKELCVNFIRIKKKKVV